MPKLKHLLIAVLFACLAFSNPVGAQRDATGADPIFEYLGLERPANWETLSRDQRFQLLEDLGIYPENGSKYQGQIPSDLSLYFEKQGLTEPENWADMTFAEKQNYLNQAITKKDNISPQEVIQENPLSKLIGLDIFNLNELSWKDLFLFFGYWAERLVIIIMFVKPAVVIFKTNWLKKIFSWRQTMGWLSTLLYFIHALGFIILYDLFGLAAWNKAYLIWGGLAGMLMLILGITSNKYSMKLLKANWKKIQRLAYPAFFFILAHTSLSKHGDLRKFLGLGGFYLIAKIVEIIWQKRKTNV